MTIIKIASVQGLVGRHSPKISFRLHKEKGREQFWPKKGNLRRTTKNLKNFTTFRVNKMFSHKF
jgi:hypothetical protein